MFGYRKRVIERNESKLCVFVSPCPVNVFHPQLIVVLYVLFIYIFFVLTRNIDFLFNYLLFTRFTWNAHKSISLWHCFIIFLLFFSSFIYSFVHLAFVCHKWQLISNGKLSSGAKYRKQTRHRLHACWPMSIYTGGERERRWLDDNVYFENWVQTNVWIRNLFLASLKRAKHPMDCY